MNLLKNIKDKKLAIKINIIKIIDFINSFSKGKKDDDYIWIYECLLDPRYSDDVCIAYNGYLSEPYCKHGLKLIRIRKKDLKK